MPTERFQLHVGDVVEIDGRGEVAIIATDGSRVRICVRTCADLRTVNRADGLVLPNNIPQWIPRNSRIYIGDDTLVLIGDVFGSIIPFSCMSPRPVGCRRQEAINGLTSE